MGKVLIIGAGGVGGVVTHKCAQHPEVFSKIVLASRSIGKCEQIEKQLAQPIDIEQVDADNVDELVKLIRWHGPDLVINVALPYQDLTIMEACLETKVNYLDTANYEPPWEAEFCYRWQWTHDNMFRRKGIMGVLGCGFDPGMTSIYVAHALKHHFSKIHHIDIMDCNGGDHGQGFATNFNPEINIREITQRGRYYLNGRMMEVPPIVSQENGIRRTFSQSFDFPQVGRRQMYLLYHEELQSLKRFIPGLRSARFWMTFGEQYLKCLEALLAVGMTSIEQVVPPLRNISPYDFLHWVCPDKRLIKKHDAALQLIGLLDWQRVIHIESDKISPLEFLKKVLPEPSSLGATYTGKTNIGCLIDGIGKDGKPLRYYIYNVCDHAEAYREVKAQAIAYTTGVPAMTGAYMMLTGKWKGRGVFNMEQLDPDPFMAVIGKHGLPYVEVFGDEVPVLNG